MKKEAEVALRLSGQFKELTQDEMKDQYNMSGNVRIATLTVPIPDGWDCITWDTKVKSNGDIILHLQPTLEDADDDEEDDDEYWEDEDEDDEDEE